MMESVRGWRTRVNEAAPWTAPRRREGWIRGKRECVRSCMRARSRESELDRAKCVCVCEGDSVCQCSEEGGVEGER